MESDFRYRVFLRAVIFVFLFLFFISNSFIHANVVEGNIASNVTVQKSIAISFSNNLSSGISFGVVHTLPATNVNATNNFLGNNTDYYLIVSNDSNTNIDFCIKASDDMKSSDLDVLGLGNESYSYSSFNNLTFPSLSNETSLTTSYVISGDNVLIGSNNYYRFWLDIPGAQPSGDYNNTIYFKGIETGTGC